MGREKKIEKDKICMDEVQNSILENPKKGGAGGIYFEECGIVETWVWRCGDCVCVSCFRGCAEKTRALFRRGPFRD